MGVMSCCREGCRNILCDWFSYTYGYLCDDCFEELCSEVIDIKKFMNNDGNYSELKEHRKNVLNEFKNDRNDNCEEEY
jgi:hypothetical protein